MEVSAAAGVASLREAQDLVLAEACAGGEVDKRMQHRAVLAGALKVAFLLLAVFSKRFLFNVFARLR